MGGRLLSVELRTGDSVAMEDPGYHRLVDLVAVLGLRIVPAVEHDHVRTVRKFLGTDLRWDAAACGPTTPARHDGRLMLTSGWGSHLLRDTVYG